MPERTIIGTTKLSPRWRMSLVKDVREAFAERGEEVEIGDRMVFWRQGDEIVIEPQ